MSKSMHSPTSRLLQSSRFFSLPRPLPQPAIDLATSTGIYRASDSATLPYPTHQVIVTPASSHFRGDWGLKRPLPSKATRSTSTPHIRVRQHDNAAHITDFGSAADHSQTVAKWQQMGVPLMVHEPKTSFTNATKSQSVYEEHLDNTDPDLHFVQTAQPAAASRYGISNVQAPKQAQRWKYNGPWLPGMQEGEFEIWLMQKIARRKTEFRKFLVERMVKRRIQEAQKTLREGGEGGRVSELRRVQLRKEVMETFELEEKRMRDDHASQHLSSELTSAICEFLDLPNLRGGTQGLSGRAASEQFRNALAAFDTVTIGPPSTHPAAGLSHIRTPAFLENHPLWGPQASKSPVLARVVRPRSNPNGPEHQAKLGVGGIVTADPLSSSFQSNNSGLLPDDANIREIYKEAERMVHSLEPDLKGGNKTWVHPETASIDEGGRIRLDIRRGDQEAIAVATNDVESIHERRRATFDNAYMPPPGSPGNARYGFSVSESRGARQPAPQRPSIRGFDDQLGRPGQLDESDALKKIQDLAKGRF